MAQRKISLLSADVIAKIAAGEVIERPVFAVKELVENSLDAQADEISIHLQDAGLKKIMVTDNGIGMNKADLQESFKLHTTSKIASEELLSHIPTLGFRGEALASIAAVGSLTIQSKPRQQTAGYKLELTKGKIHSLKPIGMPSGTTVIVNHLFHPVPARKKFLSSHQTEYRHILTMLIALAIANPQVHLLLTHNKKIIFDLPKTIDQLERVRLLLGARIFSQMLPVSYQEGYLNLSGFVAKPHLTTFLPQKQFIFVNTRKVTDKLIARAVKEAYGTMIASKSHPVFVLLLTLPYEFVDVNIHPRKEHIRLLDNKLIYDTVTKAINQTLQKNNLTLYEQTPFGLGLADAPLTNSFAGRLLKENQIPWDIRIKEEIVPHQDIIQLHNLYLLTQTKFGMVLVDQHAAHERILYEQFSKGLKEQNQTLPQYHLPKHKLLEFSLTESELLREHLSFFTTLGFSIERYQDTSFLLHAVPLLFQDRDPHALLSELLEELLEDKKIKALDKQTQKMLQFLACRTAIKAGEQLAKKQAKELLEKLEQTNNNATCPHGRPTKIIIDLDQLHRMFKRK